MSDKITFEAWVDEIMRDCHCAMAMECVDIFSNGAVFFENCPEEKHCA